MKIYLLDGTYELFRHYYALPSAQDATGRGVAAVRGVLASALGMIKGAAQGLSPKNRRLDIPKVAKGWSTPQTSTSAFTAGYSDGAVGDFAPYALWIRDSGESVETWERFKSSTLKTSRRGLPKNTG